MKKKSGDFLTACKCSTYNQNRPVMRQLIAQNAIARQLFARAASTLSNLIFKKLFDTERTPH